MKNNILRLWLTHHYLRKIGKRFPDFFITLIDEVTDNVNEKRVMKQRYIEGKKFEIISFDTGIDLRYVFKLHRQVIDKLIKL